MIFKIYLKDGSCDVFTGSLCVSLDSDNLVVFTSDDAHLYSFENIKRVFTTDI